MLKPPTEPDAAPGDNDRPVGELVHELIEDGKAYARAEVGLVKAIATAKANALKLPAILFGGRLPALRWRRSPPWRSASRWRSRP